MTKIFLEPDITQSEAKIKSFAAKYNHKLETDPKFLESEYQKHKEKNTEGIKKTASSMAIKPIVIVSALQILKFYHQHLKRISEVQPDVYTTADFTINNQAMSTKLTYCKSTSHRHLDRLLVAGILKDYRYKGSNTGFELRINNNLLVARRNEFFTEALIEKTKAENNGIIPLNKLHALQSARPTFSAYPNAYFTTWRHTAKNHKNLLIKNKIEKHGIVEYLDSVNTANTSQLKTVLNNIIPKATENSGLIKKTKEHSKLSKSSDKTANHSHSYQQTIVPDVSNSPNFEDYKNLPAVLREKFDFFVQISSNFAKNVLWPDEELSKYQTTAITDFMIKWFMIAAMRQQGNRPLTQFYNQLTARLQETRDYVSRSPERWVMSPSLYFEHKTAGFRGTKQWLENSQTKAKKQKAWNKNQKMVAQMFRIYKANPTTANYLKATQTLGKLHDKSHLELFNTCVNDPEKYSSENFNYKKVI